MTDSVAPSLHLLRDVWYSVLNSVDFDDKILCPVCRDSPKIVIMDGMTLSCRSDEIPEKEEEEASQIMNCGRYVFLFSLSFFFFWLIYSFLFSKKKKKKERIEKKRKEKKKSLRHLIIWSKAFCENGKMVNYFVKNGNIFSNSFVQTFSEKLNVFKGKESWDTWFRWQTTQKLVIPFVASGCQQWYQGFPLTSKCESFFQLFQLIVFLKLRHECH